MNKSLENLALRKKLQARAAAFAELGERHRRPDHRTGVPSAVLPDRPRRELSVKSDSSIASSVRCRTDRELPGEYRVRMQTIPMAKPSSHPADFTLAVHVGPGDTYEWSNVLLARADLNGTLELLTAAWERVLGYGPHEFKGKTLCQLIWSSQTAAADAVAAILDERNMGPVDLTVRCRGGEAKCFRLHRRLDAYANKMFIVAEETPGSQSSDTPDCKKRYSASGLIR